MALLPLPLKGNLSCLLSLFNSEIDLNSYKIISKEFIQPHHITKIIIDFFGLSSNDISAEFNIPIWGRNSPHSNYLQMLYNGNVICKSRNGAKSVILPANRYTDEVSWDELPQLDSKLQIEITNILLKLGGMQWVNTFLL